MIELKSEERTPLYEQLYAALADEIRSGQRAPGTALPGRRTMAAQLGVSIHTVDAAYQMLAAEGLAEARPRSGFYVQKTYGMLHSRGARRAAPPPPEPAETVPARGTICPPAAWTPPCSPPGAGAASSGSCSTNGRSCCSVARCRATKPCGWRLPNIFPPIAGVECTPEQIVVGAGIEYLLGCLAHLFAGGRAAVENPGYSRTRAVLQNNALPCTLVDIDAEGLSAQALEASGANLCYLTPSHHFPTGVTMPAPRRAQILAWAAARPGRYILEDDYDSEFRFDTRPLPSLQGMAGPDGPVVYLTTFSKSLAPGIRIACMVLPRSLLARYRRDFSVYAQHGGPL